VIERERERENERKRESSRATEFHFNWESWGSVDRLN
jgi:hypothetical protein